MRCPFLREQQVKSCQASPFRKSVARSSAHAELERCSSPDYVHCRVLPARHEEHPDPSRCPFLRESLAQFCAATPSPAYVPWSSSPDLRCVHDGHRFCELFLGLSSKEARRPSGLALQEPEAQTETIDGIPTPGWLFYSENHLWLDRGEDGVCHIGIDALIAQLFGTVERLSFLTVKGEAAATVVLTVRGADLTLRFPEPLPLVAANLRLRSSLERLTDDPYGAGWLFRAQLPMEGRLSSDPAPVLAGLRRGKEAWGWMAAEVRRVSERVHATLVPRDGATLVADGGRFAHDLLAGLERDEVLRLLSEVFSNRILPRTP